jgi:hypothetical protein
VQPDVRIDFLLFPDQPGPEGPEAVLHDPLHAGILATELPGSAARVREMALGPASSCKVSGYPHA